MFAVPVTGGYAICIVTRRAGPLGYFFGPVRAKLPELDELNFKEDTPVLIGKFGVLGMTSGEWPKLGSLPGWNREDWPVPLFVETDYVSEKRYAVQYAEEDLATPLRFLSLPEEQLDRLPEAGLHGHGLIESLLSDLLSESRR